MTAPSTVKGKAFWLGKYDTAEERGYYPLGVQSRFNQLFVFERAATQGDATRNSEAYLSSWIFGNAAGGGQIEDYNEGAEADRFWIAFADTRSPNIITLPPLVNSARPNSNCTSCWPLEVGNDGIAYDAFNESGTWEVWGFNEATDAYDYNGAAGVALGSIPVNKAVRFDGVIYVPRGSSGYTRITGVAGVPTCTAVAGADDPTGAGATTAPQPVAFAVFQQKLWAITGISDGGGIAYHTIVQKDAGADAWTWPFGTTTTDYPKLEGSGTPLSMAVFPDKAGKEALYIKTDRGVVIFDDTSPRFIETDIQFPPHPDVNRAMAVWRAGENLHLGVGLDSWAYSNANVIVPFRGLARDHGLPQEYRGAIKDLEPEVSCLYALVGPASATDAYTYSDTVGTGGTGDGEFDDVLGLAVDAAGNVWAADSVNERIQIFNSTLDFQDKEGTAGTGNGQFATGIGPRDLAFDGSGNLFVTDRGNNRVQKFTVSGTNPTYASQFGAAGTGNGQFNAPDGIAIKTSNGRIYVTDVGNTRVQIFDASGIYVTQFGSSGTGDGEFSNPIAVAVNQSNGDVYVVDASNDNVQQFTTGGIFIRRWGGSGSGDGQFQSPSAITIHPATYNVFVSDATRDDIQEFTASGDFIRKFGATGTGNGQFQSITGLAFNAAGTTLYASDNTNEDIQAFTADSAASLAAYPTLHAWTGFGWHGLWRGSANTTTPTVMKVNSATNGYKVRWGLDDGFCYRISLRRTMHSPRQGFLAGVDLFAASGELITGWFDAAMAGFYKLASHLTVEADSATATETIVFEYAVDGGGWESLGTINTSGETVLEFNVSSSFSRGRKFRRIRFRISLARGSTTTLTPVLKSFVLSYQKIPKNTVAHTLEIPLHRKWNGRTPAEMYDDLSQLVEASTGGEMLQLVLGRTTTASDGTETTAIRRVLPTSIAGLQDNGTGMTRAATLTLIEVRTGA
jgi:hypothetical protein